MQPSYTKSQISSVKRESAVFPDRVRDRSLGPVWIGGARPLTNAMTVDVEDYYQVEAFSHQIDRSDWTDFDGRIERNVDRLLVQFSDHGIHGTFFTLGWIAEHYPQLIKRIVEAGHELASHGYEHIRVDQQSPQAFRLDARKTKHLLEDLGGVRVQGYRAASFSIGEKTPWAFEILSEEGYAYSSSVYPIRHDLYGMPTAPRFAHKPDAHSDILEIPITTVSLLNRNFPCGGGGYFRLLPYGVSRWAMRRVNRLDGQPCVFYCHPWEIDPDQPRMQNLSLKTRVRHYVNLGRMTDRLAALLSDFAWDRMDRVFLGEKTGVP